MPMTHPTYPKHRIARSIPAALRKHAVQPDATRVPIDMQPVGALAQAFAEAAADTFDAGSANFGRPDCKAVVGSMRARLA